MKSRKIMPPRRLREEIDRYFDECIAADSFPDLAGMRIALGLSTLEMRRCMSEEYPNAQEYRAIFDEAKDRRESWLVRAMTSDNKRTSGCMNALKQKENGGYSEKNEGGTLNINVVGIPGGMNAFR